MPTAETDGTSQVAKQRRYLDAYGAGVSAVTGDPWSIPTYRAEGFAMGQILRTYAPKKARGEALLVWLTETAQAYASAQFEERKYSRGFAPSKCLEWLKSGRPVASSPESRWGRSAGRAAPPQPLNPVGRMQRRWGADYETDNCDNYDEQGRWIGPDLSQPKPEAAE